jgi:hypothetical protein
MSDFVEKLKAHGWSRPLSMSHQKSEYKEEYDTKPNMKSELDRIDGQLPYLTQPEAPVTKVIRFFWTSKKKCLLKNKIFRLYVKMNVEQDQQQLLVHGIHQNKVFLHFLILI